MQPAVDLAALLDEPRPARRAKVASLRNMALLSRIEQQQEEEIEAAAAEQAAGRASSAGRARLLPGPGTAWHRHQQQRAAGPAHEQHSPMEWQHQQQQDHLQHDGVGRSRAALALAMQQQRAGWGGLHDPMGPPGGRGFQQGMGAADMHRRPGLMGRYDLSDLDFGPPSQQQLQQQRWQQQLKREAPPLDGPGLTAQGTWQKRSRSGQAGDAWDGQLHGSSARLDYGARDDWLPRGYTGQQHQQHYQQQGQHQHQQHQNQNQNQQHQVQQGRARSAGMSYPDLGPQGAADSLLQDQLLDPIASDPLLDTFFNDWPHAQPGQAAAGAPGGQLEPGEGFAGQVGGGGAAGVQWQQYRRSVSAQRHAAAEAGAAAAAAAVPGAGAGEQLQRGQLSDSWEQLLGPGPELGQLRRSTSRQQLVTAMEFALEQKLQASRASPAPGSMQQGSRWEVGNGAAASSLQQQQWQQQQQQQQLLQARSEGLPADLHQQRQLELQRLLQASVKYEPKYEEDSAQVAQPLPSREAAGAGTAVAGLHLPVSFGLLEDPEGPAPAPSRAAAAGDAQYTPSWSLGDL